VVSVRRNDEKAEREGEKEGGGKRREQDRGEWTGRNVKCEREKSKVGEEPVRGETRDG